MERLWSPWRMAYIEVPKVEGCVFCALSKQSDDRRDLVLHRGEHALVMMNLFPYNNGHLMVAPYRHTADLVNLSEDEQRELMLLTRYSVRVLQHAYHPEGFNLGMNLGSAAGAGIAEHLHQHIVPRWNGDTNFMPILGETKVLPDTLFGTYDKLAAVVAEIGPPAP